MTEKNRDPHREWLDLLDTDGPFLSVPVLKKAWPTGMNAPDRSALEALRDAKPAFEKAWDAWDLTDKDTADRGAAALEEYRQARDAWVDVILRTVLGWKNFYLTPASVDAKVHSPDYAVTVSPTGALVRNDITGALVLVTDPVDSLRDSLNDGWAASPIDRMEELLRVSGVRIGVVTDGRWWAVVSARPETMVASGITDSQRWIELPAVRDAFLQLLRLPRLAGNRKEDLLTELFGDSVAAAEEITEALGTNVRRAVELLVQALSESALAVRRRGEPDPLPEDRDEVYQAAVTVMMRVVFLLFSEERSLLPQGQLFTGGYGISDELDTLDQRARDEGAEALDSSHLTWHRLLATSQALYRGASFEDIRLPSYGGSLFDPARFLFLTARDSYDSLAVTVTDRVMLEVLRAAQIAELRGEPARRISFRDIDVEQIGYIYEGLLGYSATDVDEVVVGLTGKRGEEPEIPLSLLERFAASRGMGDVLANAILDWVKNDQPAAVAPTKSALAKAIRDSGLVEDADRALRAVAPGDEPLRERLRPFLGAIRRDLRGRPTVFLQVGVDVDRLGLMLVVGQPKNTAEYIQASSRVGRQAGRPGLVVTLGNWARPRDLAHFEQFRHYHETFYAQVEALSVTPFSATSLDRGLDGVLVSAARVLTSVVPDGLSPERSAGRIESQRDFVLDLIDGLVRRTRRAADDGAAGRARQRLLNRLDQWTARRKHLADLHKTLVYERVTDDAKYDALMMSAENARARGGGGDAPPFVVANSMREVQPEINLLVSPIKDNLVYIAPPGAPRWEFPAEQEASS